MKKGICLIVMSIPVLLFAQSDTSNQPVNWIKELTWDQVQQRAKNENKYIFVDCYATWCQPCLWMDKEVYSKEKIGKFANEQFISIRLQTDTGKQDDEQVKGWYSIAKDLITRYKISELPTFLFFSPNAELVHRETGLKKVDEFIALLKDATDTSKQVYRKLDRFKTGLVRYEEMPELAKLASRLKEADMANTIAKAYFDNYFFDLPLEKQLTKTNIAFVASFISDTRSKNFQLFVLHSKKIDSIVGQQKYSEKIIDYAITKEMISPILHISNMNEKRPKWKQLYHSIKRKFDKEHSSRTIIDAKIRWYGFKNDWPNLAKYNIKKIEKYGIDTAGIGKYLLSNMIWKVIFQHSNKKKFINKGIEWMEIIVEALPHEPISMSCYASLLYKAGRRVEAIEWEEKAVKLEEAKGIKDNRAIPDKIYSEILEKMRKGEPTWPVE